MSKYTKLTITTGSIECRRRKIAIGFDPELFKKIAELAFSEKKSFGAKVNELVEKGMINE